MPAVHNMAAMGRLDDGGARPARARRETSSATRGSSSGGTAADVSNTEQPDKRRCSGDSVEDDKRDARDTMEGWAAVELRM